MLSCVFLLNRRYQPYYKWSFRALRGLPLLSELARPLEYLLTTANEDALAREKAGRIERLAGTIARELRRQGLSALPGDELERHAYAVHDGIRDAAVRNLHILAAV